MSQGIVAKNPSDYRSFKEKYSFETRVTEAKKKREENPSLIPLIVEKHHRSKLPQLERLK